MVFQTWCIAVFGQEGLETDTLPPVPGDEMQLLQDTLATDAAGEEEPERLEGTSVILEDKVEYSAEDTIFHDIRNQKVFIYGNADLRYEDMHLSADFIEIDFSKNELFASGLPDTAGVVQGKPVFREGAQSFQSDELRYNFETRRGRTIGVVTEEADGFVHGDVVKLQPTREVHVAEGKYTTCDHPEPHFHIAFRRAKIIPDDKIVSSLAYLVIRDVPTPLFVPFGFFPNRRGQASGILIPSYGESRNRGFYLENGGFYWGINDYIDLSIRGDIFSRGSWALRLGSDYAVRYRYSGNVNLGYAVNVLGERNLPGYERSRDFRIQWSHSQAPQAHPTRNFRANVNIVSAQTSRFNPVSDDDYLSNTFSSNVSYSRSWANRYNLSANLRHSQNINNRMVDMTLPDINFNVSRFYPFRSNSSPSDMRWFEDINMTYSMSARNQISIADSLLFTQDALSAFRSGVRHEIPISYSTRVLNHFNLSSNINYNERWYFSTIRESWEAGYDEDDVFIDDQMGEVVRDTISEFAAIRDFSFSTGLSTRLYGMMQFQRGPVTALRHVMTPNVGFSFRPDFADPFWGYYDTYYDPVRDQDVQYAIFQDGIFGGPQAGRSGNLSLSISNNLEMKVRNRRDPDAEERKIVLVDNFRISTGYDVARDSLNVNDLRLSGRTRLWGNFDISYSSSWTPYARDEDGQLIDKFLWNTNNRLLQLNNTNWGLNLNYTLRSGQRRNGDNGDNDFTPAGDTPPGQNDGGMGHRDHGNGMPMDDSPEMMPANGVDYSVPWNLTFSYSFDYRSTYRHAQDRMERNYIQSLSVRGDVHLTPNWRIGFRSGYDFDNHKLTYTSIDVYRDLHCWEMTFNWIPMGFRQSYNFTIRVKSSVLQDLKLTRRRHHLDGQF